MYTFTPVCILVHKYIHRQKYYKKMSEIKPEVEYVIKTGRQVADKKQVDFPHRLNSQIDAIKLQYNKLGAQV
ncbi:hypothetical protein HELRODRAFT_86683 [Helobdella robusta]|uniref:Uncharacterized protein n=1 Tax=Helobdella robusta TaxID=6412 RepID=T1G6F3_HELRO|nr:hypothetical protein HELRODRAFT_86683 [Helobdella robusta]ESN95568.1 hypothetical protein HELRODRAFT_86683 [Helobdella robusta]